MIALNKMILWCVVTIGAFALIAIVCDTYQSDQIQDRIWEIRQIHHRADVKQTMIDFELNMDDAILLQIEVDQMGRKVEQLLENTNPHSTSPVKCLADNIYYEAANEPEEGKVAVAQVTMNRLADKIGGDTVCDVVYFKKINPNTGKKEAAFSWTLGPKWRPKGKIPVVYNECVEIAKAVLNGLRSDIIGSDVEYYHANYINPSWSKDHELVARIGQHIFYR